MIPKKAKSVHLDEFRPITLNSRINLCFNKLLETKIIDQL